MITKLPIALLTAVLALLPSLQALARDIYLVKDNKIVATYSLDDVDYITFDPNGITPADFLISIDKTDFTGVEWTVTPADDDMYYYSGVYTEEALRERFDYSVDNMAATIYNDMQFLAGMAGIDINEFMSTAVLKKGKQQFADYQLGAGSQYVLVVFGCSPDGEATTSTYTGLDFSTKSVDMNGLTVDFGVTINSTNATVTATPSDPSLRYYMKVQPADQEIDLQGSVNNELWRGGILGKTEEEIIAEITNSGTVTKTLDLDPDTEYVVYACSLTADGIVNSEVSSKKFKTGTVGMSDNTFAITVSGITPLSATVNITPSNSDTYSIGVVPASDFEGKTDAEVLDEYVMNGFNAAYYTTSGPSTTDFSLDPDTEYVAFAFGYSHSVVTTPMTKTAFKTLPPSDPKTWTATFGDVRIEDGEAYVQINVNQEDVLYLWNVVDADGTEEQIYDALLREYDRCADKGFNYVEAYGITGSNEVSFSGLEEGGTYKFFAVVMNPETKELETPFFYSATFNSQGMVTSSKTPLPAKVAKSLKLLAAPAKK